MAQFKKKPVVIEAIQWLGKNWPEIEAFSNGNVVGSDQDDTVLECVTIEGVMRVEIGSWIIRGIKGEFYPCKPDIFEATYEKVEA